MKLLPTLRILSNHSKKKLETLGLGEPQKAQRPEKRYRDPTVELLFNRKRYY